MYCGVALISSAPFAAEAAGSAHVWPCWAANGAASDELTHAVVRGGRRASRERGTHASSEGTGDCREAFGAQPCRARLSARGSIGGREGGHIGQEDRRRGADETRQDGEGRDRRERRGKEDRGRRALRCRGERGRS